MRHWLLSSFILFTSSFSFAQNTGVGIGTTNPHPSAELDISSTGRGFLLPRLTTAQRDAMISPATGLQIFNSTTNCIQIFAFGVWQNVFCTIDPDTFSVSIAKGLTAYYPFNGNANDESGNGRHGTQYGVSYAPDRKNNLNSSCYFNGATQAGSDNRVIVRDQGVNVNNFNVIFNSNFSLSVWLNISPTSFGDVINKRTDNNIDFCCTIGPNNVPYLHLGSLGYSMASSTVPFNEWHHYLYTYSNGVMRTYLDGTLSSEKSITGDISNNTLSLSIGKYVYHGGYTHYFYYNGYMDELRIYNRALSQAEITYLATY